MNDYVPLRLLHLQHDHVVGVDAGDAHHQDGGEDEEDVEEGQAQQEYVDGADHCRPAKQ